MLIDTKIQKIVGGGHKVNEVRYMDEIVWKEKEDIKMIITNLDDTKYFYINNKGRYQLINKPEYQFMTVYLCVKAENKTLINIYKEVAGLEVPMPTLENMKCKNRDYNRAPYSNIDYLGYAYDYYIKLLISTPLSKTVILVNHTDNTYDIESESKEVIEKFETL